SSSRSIRRRTDSRWSGLLSGSSAPATPWVARGLKGPRSLRSVANPTHQPAEPTAPRVQVDVGDRTSLQLQADPGARREHGAYRTEGGRCLRIEPFDRLREPPVSPGHDRPPELLG